MTDMNLLKSFKNTKKGYPLLLHSFKPYSAFNFQASGLFTLKGNYTWVGIIGLSLDGENYVVARYNGSEVQFCKVRNGTLTVLNSVGYQLVTTLPLEVRFYITLVHKNGVFNIYINFDEFIQNPVLTYRWTAADGVMCADNDLFHVGAYSFIDPPHFRITSFDVNNCDGVPYLPGTDKSELSLFPSSGDIQIDEAKYHYTSKTPDELMDYRGPYQVRNIGTASYTNPDSGLAFSGKYMEVAMFEWLNTYNDLNGYLLATDAQYGWLISAVDRKTFLNSSTWMKHKARFFCPSKGVVSTTHRAWVTCGLLGVTLFYAETNSPTHNLGAVCFLDTNDEATLHMFIASSGDKDATVGDLLESVSKMSGIKPMLTGDIVHGSITLSSTGSEL